MNPVKVKVVMTHDEVIDACRAWMSDHGLPEVEFLLKHEVNDLPYVNGKPLLRVEAVASFETDHFTHGPYR